MSDEWLKRPIVLLSGGRTTLPLAEPLSKLCQVAVFDLSAAQAVKSHVEELVCPELGAGPHLRALATNDAATMASRVLESEQALETLRRNGTRPRNWVPGLVVGAVSQVAFDLRVLEAFCEQADVRCIVTHEDVTPRFKALALFGRSRGIPTVHVPHANHFINTQPDVHDECVCDYILAAGAWMRDWYAKRGFPKRRIRVTGFPNWDKWVDINGSVDKVHARKVLAIPQDKPAVLYCTSWPQTTNAVDDHSVKAQADVAVLQAAKLNDWTLIWSMHPGDKPEWQRNYAELARQYGVPALVVRGHLNYTARAADVAISVGPSNVLVECAIAGTPPVEIPIRGYDYPATPPWRVRPDAASISATVRRLLDSSALWENERERFVTRFAYRNDGKAIERIVSQVMKIAGISQEAGGA